MVDAAQTAIIEGELYRLLPSKVIFPLPLVRESSTMGIWKNES